MSNHLHSPSHCQPAGAEDLPLSTNASRRSPAAMSGTSDLQSKGSWDRVAKGISDGLYSAMYVGGGDAGTSSPIWLVLVAIQYLQFLYYPIALMLGGGQLRAVLAQVLKLTSLTRVDEELGPTGLVVATIVVSEHPGMALALPGVSCGTPFTTTPLPPPQVYTILNASTTIMLIISFSLQ